MAALALEALPTITAGAGHVLNAMGAATALHSLGSRYTPGIKKLANTNFSRKAQSAVSYVKGLGTARGLKKFVTKDVPTAASKASRFISSGKALKAAGQVAGDIGRAVDIVHGVTGQSELGSRIKEASQQALKDIHHHHEILEQYNEKGKELASQFRDQYNQSADAYRNM